MYSFTKTFSSLLLGLCFCLSALAQDAAEAPRHSLGINVAGAFDGGLPDFLYVKRRGNAAMRISGALYVTNNIKTVDEIECEWFGKVRTNYVGVQLGWGKQWYIPVKWASFYGGFELQGRYGNRTYFADQSINTCSDSTFRQTIRRNKGNDYALGAALIAGGNFPITKRFSISIESDLTGNVQVGNEKRNSTEIRINQGIREQFESEDTASSPAVLSWSAFPTIRVFANIHF